MQRSLFAGVYQVLGKITELSVACAEVTGICLIGQSN